MAPPSIRVYYSATPDRDFSRPDSFIRSRTETSSPRSGRAAFRAGSRHRWAYGPKVRSSSRMRRISRWGADPAFEDPGPGRHGHAGRCAHRQRNLPAQRNSRYHSAERFGRRSSSGSDNRRRMFMPTGAGDARDGAGPMGAARESAATRFVSESRGIGGRGLPAAREADRVSAVSRRRG